MKSKRKVKSRSKKSQSGLKPTFIHIVLAIALILGFAYWIIVAKTATATTPKTALIYGDSLTWESMSHITQQFAKKSGWTRYVHAFPSTPPCLWNTWLAADLAQYNPSVVALTTAANTYNASYPCMVDSNGNPLVMGTPEYYAKYESDLNTFFATVTATGAKVVYVKAPPMLDPVRNAAIIEIANRATQAAGNYHGVSISNVVRAALAKNGKYTATKPCLAIEASLPDCVNNTITIRTITGPQTGLHLCPGGLPDVYPFFCKTYSSGEYRFGKNLVNTIVNPPPPILP